MDAIPDPIRFREVQRLTGWHKKYILKLVREGIIDVWRPLRHAKGWYSRKQILQLLSAENKIIPNSPPLPK